MMEWNTKLIIVVQYVLVRYDTKLIQYILVMYLTILIAEQRMDL